MSKSAQPNPSDERFVLEPYCPGLLSDRFAHCHKKVAEKAGVNGRLGHELTARRVAPLLWGEFTNFFIALPDGESRLVCAEVWTKHTVNAEQFKTITSNDLALPGHHSEIPLHAHLADHRRANKHHGKTKWASHIPQ